MINEPSKRLPLEGVPQDTNDTIQGTPDKLPLWWFHPESDSFIMSETHPTPNGYELMEVGRFATEADALASMLAEEANEQARLNDPELTVRCATFRPDIISEHTRNKMERDRKEAQGKQ